MTLQSPEFQQVDLDMEQVRVRIGDDEILVSWHQLASIAHERRKAVRQNYQADPSS